MRIVLVNTYKIWGGGEKWHYEAALFFALKGHDVTVLTSPDSLLSRKLENTKIKLLYFNFSKFSYYSPLKLLSLYLAFRKNRFDIMVLNSVVDVRNIAIIAKISGISKVIYRSGMPLPLKPKRSYKMAFNFGVDEIVAISREVMTVMETTPDFVYRCKKRVIYNGIKKSVLDKNSAYQKEITAPIVIGDLARLSKQKGYIYLLKAIVELKKMINIPFKVLIAGAGEQEEELKAFVKKQKLNEIEFLGHVENINSFFRQIDIFLFSSLFEGSTHAILEAFSYKKPVICFDTSSMPEMVVDGYNGLLVTPFDVSEMATKMLRLIENEDLIRTLGENAYHTLGSRFLYEKNMEEWSQVIQVG